MEVIKLFLKTISKRMFLMFKKSYKFHTYYIMNNINIQKMKLYVLQKRYYESCNSVRKVQDHIDFLFRYNFIEYLERNTVLSNLFEISKSINSKYNEYINDEIENNEESDSNDLIESFTNDEIVYNSLDNLDEYFKNNNKINIVDISEKPLEEFNNSINSIIEKYGYGGLIDTLKTYVGDVKFNLINGTDLKFLQDLNFLTYSVSIEQIKVGENKIDFYLH